MWGHELNYTATIRDPSPPTPQTAGTQYFAMDVDEVPAVGGSRPDRLPDVSGPQERVQRRTVQQIVDYLPLPILDDLAPQMVGQVIEMPKIPWIWTMRRFVDFLRQPQTAEQLVEVPTIISFSMIALLHALLEQRTAEQIVDNPVPRPGGAGDLRGFLRGQGSTAFSEQIPEFPDPGDQDFQPVQGSAASSSDSLGQAGQGVFSIFHRKKKSAKIPRTQGSELGAESSSWTP